MDSIPQSIDMSALFGTPCRETCYGYITDEEYERRLAVDRAKWDAIAACPFCDPLGYRNMYVCNHKDPSEQPGKAARRALQKRRLRVIDGGDA